MIRKSKCACKSDKFKIAEIREAVTVYSIYVSDLNTIHRKNMDPHNVQTARTMVMALKIVVGHQNVSAVAVHITQKNLNISNLLPQ